MPGIIRTVQAISTLAVIQLYTLLESPNQLQFTELYRSLGIEETRFGSSRQLNKAIAVLKKDVRKFKARKQPKLHKASDRGDS